MTKPNWLKSCSILAVSVAVALPAITITTAQAQDDEIVIIGSRLKRKSQSDLPSPVQTVGSEDVSAIGAKNIADITQTLTINTGAQNNPDAFTQGSTTGTSSINLRGLGLSSTLILLNGKRQVQTATTTNDGLQFVDTSSLVPLIAIERVDILKDGASALYGSDAVAGVVNFVTLGDYEGVKLSGTYQTVTGTGSSDEYLVQGLFGKNFNRGNILGAISYLERTPLTTAEKRLSRAIDDSSALGNPGAFFGVPGFPPTAPVIDPTGCAEFGGIPQVISATPAGVPDVGLCRFDFGEFFNLIADETRFTGYLQGDFEVTDTVGLKLELTYADNEAVRGNSPTFPFLQRALVPPTNPNNIFGAPVVFFGRAIGNGGSVSPNTTENETIRFAATLDGEFANDGTWEVSYTYGENDSTVATEDTVTDRFQCSFFGFDSATAAAFGVTDVNLATGVREPGCNNVIAAGAPVGQFFNPFATSFTTAPNSQGVLDFIIGTSVSNRTSELNVIEGVVTKTIRETENGPVGLALGFQYREETLDASFDALTQNDNFGFLIGDQNYSGTLDVYGLYGELGIPLSPTVDLQLALRFEDYGGQIGDTIDPKIALLIRPTDALSLRGSFSTSFRAPSVFQSQGQGTSLNQAVDPVTGGTAFIAVRSVGNPNLEPEESEAYNLGLTWKPADGLTIDLDYYNFDFSSVIIPEAFQALINANPVDTRFDPTNSAMVIPGREACTRANTIVCRVADGQAGTILQVNSNFVNASSVETSGIDFKIEQQIDTDNRGLFVPFIEGTYILEYDLQDPQAGAVDGAGSRNFNNFGTSTPELRVNAGVAWQKGPHSANVFVRHTDSYTDDQNNVDIDSHTTLDWQYNIAVSEYFNTDRQVSFTLGMINAFDQDPPQVFTNGGFDSKVHDPRGQLTYIGLDIEF